MARLQEYVLITDECTAYIKIKWKKRTHAFLAPRMVRRVVKRASTPESRIHVYKL